MESFNTLPDFNNYLAHILTRTNEDAHIRAIAGLILKNNIRNNLVQLNPGSLDYVKQCALEGLGNRDSAIRSIASIIITTFLTRFGVVSWPEALEHIAHMLDSREFAEVDGAFCALVKIFEDMGRELDNEGAALGYIVPKVLGFFAHDHVRIKTQAIACCNQLVPIKSTVLFAHLDSYMHGLFECASDNHAEVQKQVCQAFVMLLEVRPEVLMPQFDAVVKYMQQRTQDDDEAVALEACEFWLSFAEQEDMREHMRPYLGTIIPMLLRGMVYNEMDLLLLAEDDEAPDRDQDIRPRHHKAAEKGEESEDEDDDDEEEGMEWNVRKCSAAGLDVISTLFKTDILPVVLPLLRDNLYSQEWKVRESGVLALGAIAEGCMEGLHQHLPALIPYLLNSLLDQQALVRSISCWTLSRFSEWVVNIPEQNERNQYLEPLIKGLLEKILDSSKKVQEAACSAFATLEEEAEDLMVPYLHAILTAFSMAFARYQKRNLLILLDAVGTLADAVGQNLNQQPLVELLMPPLLHKWETTSDDDKSLFALLECMASIAVALGPDFSRFCAPVWSRALRLLSTTMLQQQMHLQSPDTVDSVDNDVIVVSLDLISGIVQGLSSSCDQFIASSDPPLLPLVVACLSVFFYG